MNFIGKEVTHSKFGKGIITQQDEYYVSVEFTNESDPKKFVYPMCFENFLKLSDNQAAVQMSAIIEQYTEQKHEEQQEAEKEIITRRYSKKLRENINEYKRKALFQSYNSVADFCIEYKQALNAEIFYQKSTGGKRQHIFNGKRVEHKNHQHMYVFESDDELIYPEETQINIWQDKTKTPGKIVACEDFTVIIATDTSLGDDIKALNFSAESWKLLEPLIDCLNNLSTNHSAIVKELVCRGQSFIDCKSNNIATGQQAAIHASQNQPITFVWGPPGTGKTQTLASIALAHINQGNRVLMLSYSNVAVDAAIMRVHKLNPNMVPGTIVRYGYPRNKFLLEHEYLTSYNYVIYKHPVLWDKYQELIAQRKDFSKESPEYIQTIQKLKCIKDTLAAEEKNIVKAASFVATTVSKAIMDYVLRYGDFDVVIFDEASMAYIPQIVFAASLAKKHFICMGDFNQLPPIVQSGTRSPLNIDIFHHCGITLAIETGIKHKWLCLLNTQYRMHPCIADFTNQSMYGGLLRSEKNLEKNLRSIVDNAPAQGHAIVFADLSGMMSVCTKTVDNSRVNILSAMISFSLALEAAQSNDVAIITPYHAQSRLFHAMAKDVAETNSKLHPIACATVHQFQGSEKDIIVYDAVDCYRMSHPGMLLTYSQNNYANRLYNVALTRAKGKFINVANIAYMDNKALSKELIFKHMIDNQRSKQSCLSGHSLIRRQLPFADKTMCFFDTNECNTSFISDILRARHEIRIDIPDKPTKTAANENLAAALQKAKKNGVKVYLRAENKQEIPSDLKPFAIENAYVANPVTIIDKEIVWFGLPNSDANFKTGDQTIQTQYRPIIRFKGSYTAKAVYGFIDMNNTVDQSKAVVTNDTGEIITDTFASYVQAHKKCHVCGKSMRLQKSRRGKFFLACTGYPDCRETALIDVFLLNRYFSLKVNDGQRCIRCNSLLKAHLGQYGIYIQCEGVQKHKYKPDEI